MVPVMIMGTLIGKKSYSMFEYICMSLIGMGVAMFGSKSSHKVSSKLHNANVPLGYSLCLANLTLDGKSCGSISCSSSLLGGILDWKLAFLHDIGIPQGAVMPWKEDLN
jgi:UDP-galactose transporter B1